MPGNDGVIKLDDGKVVFLVEFFEDGQQRLSCLQRVTKSGQNVGIYVLPDYQSEQSVTWCIFLPDIDPLLSITNTTFFGTLGKSGGAKKCTK